MLKLIILLSLITSNFTYSSEINKHYLPFKSFNNPNKSRSSLTLEEKKYFEISKISVTEVPNEEVAKDHSF